MRHLSTRPIVMALACLCVVACVRPQQNPWRLFTLSPLPRAEQTTTSGRSSRVQPAIGIGPIHLPEYLDQDQIVNRISKNRLTLSANDRWAEPLAHNVESVLAENLSILLAADDVTAHSWPNRQRSSYQLEIDVLRFETDSTGTAHLAARYFLRDGANGQTIATKEARLSAAAVDRSTEQSVASLSKALGDFSAGIADVIREQLRAGTAAVNDTQLTITPTLPRSSSHETRHR